MSTLNIQAQNQKGSNWEARKTGNEYIVSVKTGAKVSETLTDFAKSQHLTAGEVTGIGAVKSATLRFFDPKTKQYEDKTFDEQMEISNLSGNISVIEGDVFLHLHATLGRKDYTALAGHLQEATINGAGEFFFKPEATKIVKTKNEDIGLNIYDFNQ